MAAVQENLRPGRTEKILGALKAERAVKRITFDRTEANPEETLYVSVPKLNENEVIVPGSLALRFNIDLSGGQPTTFWLTTSAELWRSATTGCQRAFRARTLTKFAQMLAIRKLQALYNDLVFELKLAAAEHVVRGSDTTKLKYKLTNIQLEYEMIRSEEIADEAFSAYSGGKEFAYDHIQRVKVVTFARLRHTSESKGHPQRRSMRYLAPIY
ncbi:hypothetical protein ACROYT_G025049 [Oculina patagonica]